MIQSKGSQYPLRDAIIAAATELGENGRGKDGMVGYFKQLARKEPKLFAGLLKDVLTLPLAAPADKFDDIATWSAERIAAEMKKEGIRVARVNPFTGEATPV